MILLSPDVSAQDIELAKENVKDYVAATLPYSLDFVRDNINVEFDSDARAFFEDYDGAIYALPDQAKTIKDLSASARKKFIAFPIVRSNKFYVFYGNYQNMQSVLKSITPYSMLGVYNPALARYADLPEEARANDIYLWSPDAPFWYSEYAADGNPAPFRSYFIIHLTAADASNTTVEIIEHNPVVNAGRRLTIDANGTMHHFDIRDVAPTTHDREYLLYCINQFIERRIPNRHVFNCLTEDELADLKKRAEKHRELEKEIEEMNR